MSAAPKKELTLFDSTCLIVGIIIGVGIYQMAPDIAKGAGGAWQLLLLWLVGGLLSLCGALGYAELATAYPQEGGDYVYLSRAYGRWAGFLFGWLQMVIVRPGDIAVMAFAFAMYAERVWAPAERLAGLTLSQVYAAAAILVLTVINVLGVREGKWTQNVLTVLKAVGLLAIVGVALVGPRSLAGSADFPRLPTMLALIFVLFTFGGWNEMAYVAAEVRDPDRNIVRALVLGTAAVTALYLAVNAAFLWSLGYAGLASSTAVAADVVGNVFPNSGSRLISALICISALGAVNGLIFAGARISYAVGSEYRAFGLLGRWSRSTGTPAWALTVQGALALAVVLVLGNFLDAVIYTAPAVYSFYLATSLAVIVLRFREPQTRRPYRVTAYPLPTLLFCAACALLIYSSVTYKPKLTLVSLGILVLGLPVYWLAAAPSRVEGREAGADEQSGG